MHLRVSFEDVEYHLGRTPAEELVFQLRPDIVLRDDKRTVAIVDAKWKGIDLEKRGYAVPSRSDVHQMHAYATAYGCTNVLLVYPSAGNAPTAKESIFLLRGAVQMEPRLRVAFLDLHADPFRLLSRSQNPLVYITDLSVAKTAIAGLLAGRGTFADP